MASSLTIDRNEDGDKLSLSFKGHINEDSDLTVISFDGIALLDLDLNGVVSLNSLGIRTWLSWMKLKPANCKVVMRNCPKIVIDQINMISGFLPSDGEVVSFYVPYFCEESGGEMDYLYTSGKEFNGSQLNHPQGLKCDKSGEPMEIDVMENTYFKFLG